MGLNYAIRHLKEMTCNELAQAGALQSGSPFEALF